MANVTITQLPAAGAITGDELVPVVQNGVTVHTTTGAIAASPSQTQTFLTLNNEPTLPNSRYLSTGSGLGLTDGGAQSYYRITLNGASGALESLGNGFVVKTSSTTLAAREIDASGAGISIADGDGQSGNPTVSLTGLPLALANASGSGLLALRNSTTLSPVAVTGTANQIGVTNGNGLSGNPTVSIVDNAILPGTEAVRIPTGTTAQRASVPVNGDIRYNSTSNRFEGYQGGSWANLGAGDGTVTYVAGTVDQIDVVNNSTTPTISITDDPIIPGLGGMILPKGTTAQRATPENGLIRYNTDTETFEGYANGVWGGIAVGVGVTSVGTGTGLEGGPITSTGTISISDTGVTAGSYGSTYQVPSYTVNAQGQLTAAANIAISATDIGAVTSVTGTANEIASTGGQTPVISLPSALTFTGKTVTGGTFYSGTITSATIGGASVINDSVIGNLTPAAATFTNLGVNGSMTTNINFGGYSITNAAEVDGNGTLNLKSQSGGASYIQLNETGASYAGAASDFYIYSNNNGYAWKFGGDGVLYAPGSIPVVTTSGTQTLTNKTIDGSTNTLQNIANASLVNSSITLGTTNIALGATELTPAGLTSVTVTQNPTSDFQLATKQYVDNLVATGTTYHDPVYVESPDSAGNLNATYDNGTAGVGATLTNAGTLEALTIDGVLMTTGKRVLIYNQTNGFENGIYTVTTVGDGSTAWVLTRATDADSYGPGPDALDQGSTFFVTDGDTGAGETYTCTTEGAITFGTTAITFSQIGATQVYSAGTGLTLTNTQFSITNTAVSAGSYGDASKTLTATVNAQGQLTALADTPIAIANTQVSGLGTMSVQNANSVAITGGAIDGTPVGGTTASTGSFTTLSASGDGTFSGTGQIKLPAGTSLQRTGSPVNGMIRYNTDTVGFEGYSDGAWGALGGGGGAVADGCIYTNFQTIYGNFTFDPTTNGSSVGTITIDAGAVVTVPTGSRWVIL